MTSDQRQTLLIYAAALAVGVVAMLTVMPVDALLGTGRGWNPPGPDQAQSLAGHLVFQADTWHWPLLQVQRLFWPHGISLALVDSDPLVSLLAKLSSRLTGHAPMNWLGAFLGLCWLLQPVAGAYAARGLRVGPAAALAAAVLAVAWPALMFRMMHINLCAHGLILFALGLTFRGIERQSGWAWPGVLLFVSVLVHPYLFQLAAAVLAAVPLHAAMHRRAGWQRDLGGYLLSGVFAVGVLMLLSGPLGGGDKGFTFFSMNLVSPVWPQRSGVFGPSLPIVDATGGQYEGFNWLGAGTLLLLAAAVVGAVMRRQWPRPALALAIILVGLTLVSLSSQVHAGSFMLLDLGVKPWEDVFGSFRSSGRAFWPVGYALMLAGVAAADRLPRRVAPVVLLAAVALQIVDLRPLWHDARGAWENGSGIATPPVPAGTTLFTAAPHPGCAREVATKLAAPVMLLDAARQGAQLGDIGIGRSPPWFTCERILSDSLELPLLPMEARAFFGTPVQAVLNPALLGADAVCRRSAEGPVVCGRDVAVTEGEVVPGRPVGPPPKLPFQAGETELEPLLGSGWRPGLNGGAWSEGPQSTLLIPVIPGQRLTLRLRASGIGFLPGEARRVTVSAGRVPVGQFTLPDGMSTDVAVAIPASTTADGMLRVSLDVVRPVDPARRGITAPVRRAAMRLAGLTLQVE